MTLQNKVCTQGKTNIINNPKVNLNESYNNIKLHYMF